MPSIYPNHPKKPQSKQNHDQTIHQTSSQPLTVLPDIDKISHPINHNHALHVETDADATKTAATLPNYITHNSHIGSNSKSIFIPVSTSKYPIDHNTYDEEYRERFVNFLTQWIRAFVYLARK